MTAKSTLAFKKSGQRKPNGRSYLPLPALVGGVAMAVVLYFLNAPPFLIAASTALIIGVRIWGRR